MKDNCGCSGAAKEEKDCTCNKKLYWGIALICGSLLFGYAAMKNFWR